MIWIERLVSLLAIVILWQAAVSIEIVPEQYLPGPMTVVAALFDLVQSGEAIDAEVLTLSRALFGLAVTLPLGIGLAVLAWLLRPVRLALQPVLELLRPIPPAAIVPVTIFMIGFGMELYLFTIVFVTVWPIYLNTLAALDGVNDVQLQTGRAYGCSRAELVRSIVLPQALPQIFVGIRIAAAISLIAAVVTELLTGRDGIGYLLFSKAFALRIPEVFALTLLCGLNGILLNQLVNFARSFFIGWHIRMTAEAAS